MLKNFRKLIGGSSTDRSTSSSNNNINSSPIGSNITYNSNTLNKRESKAVQQAAAVAAAAAAANAHTINNSSSSSSNIENGSGSYESQGFNQHYQQQQQQQYYHLNATRSLSPSAQPKSSYNIVSQQQNQQNLPPPPPPPPIAYTSLQNTSSISLSNSNLKQQNIQFQQQQQNSAAAAAAATAAAEFYEQQMKLQQQKNIELEQDFRTHLEQLKDLKDTVNNLNEMNRKLHDENQQFKERNIEQRQQIEHYHVLLQENQQKAEQSLNQIRKERDEAYLSESDTKRRMQLTIDTIQHENFQAINNWKEKFEQLKECEIRITQELNTAKAQIKQEKNKSELLEKKFSILQKECELLKDNWNTERSCLEEKIKDYSNQLEISKNQLMVEKQMLDEKHTSEKNELKIQLKNLEDKIEEVVKEKAEINYNYGQIVESNRELNNICQSKESTHGRKAEEMKSRLDFYINKCNDLEKEIFETQESHLHDTEEWKKFQADLQTAVRVANDFMIEAEEKMNKMKDDYVSIKEKESQMIDEIERLKKKLCNQESAKSQSTFNHSKQNKENEDTMLCNIKNMTDIIDSSNNIVLTPLLLNNPDSSASNKMNISHRNNSSSQLGLSACNSTDTDDAKIYSSRSNNQTAHYLLSTPYVSKKDYLSENDLIKKSASHLKATSSSSLLDSANLIQNANICLTNSDLLSNLVKQYGVSKRNALIKWCQERLSTYNDIEIKNFSSSWNDGLAFCALLHSFMPDGLDYESLKSENNPRKNFQTAFKIAQAVGIQQTLNINELLNNERPDWNTVMNYVALIYKHFQTQKLDDTKGCTPSLNISSKSKKILSTDNESIIQTKSGRSSSSSPTALRNIASSVQNNLPLSLSASTTSTNSNGSSFSASSSSSSISKTIN